MGLPFDPDETPDSALANGRVVFRLRRLVQSELSLGETTFPVFVHRPGFLPGELNSSIVYGLGALAARPCPDGGGLEDAIGRVIIGRTEENDIVIDEATVSRRHATLVRWRSGRWSVVDEGSLNGTFLDGKRLPARCATEIRGAPATIRFGMNEIFAFMDGPSFESYVASLRVEVEARATAATRAGGLDRPKSSPAIPLSASWESPVEEYVAARILDALRAARFDLQSCSVRLEGGEAVVLETWGDLVSFVERNGRRIEEVAVDTGSGPAQVVYARGAVEG
jgi:pSer/pThr/pTyr-binding forkhead associated (FHA) protein